MSKTRELADVSLIKSASAPSSPSAGDMWYDTTSSIISNWDGNKWISMTNVFDATGGTISTYSSGATNYQVHTFTSSGTFTVNSGNAQADLLIVAGGGGGGADNAGGGGAGGLLYYGIETPKTPNGTRVNLLTGDYSIVIGAGGRGGLVSSGGSGTSDFSINGSNSTAFGYTALGGGAGACSEGGSGSPPGAAGGSGGGGNGNTDNTVPLQPGSGTAGQGNAGGTGANGGGGGGGGAGSVGQNGNVRASQHGGAGGAGLQYSISGSASWYAAGGDGGNENNNFQQYSRPSGIGGQSPAASNQRPTDGVANTGAGGGGGTHTCVTPTGQGGSGIVIIRYEV